MGGWVVAGGGERRAWHRSRTHVCYTRARAFPHMMQVKMIPVAAANKHQKQDRDRHPSSFTWCCTMLKGYLQIFTLKHRRTGAA